MKSTKNYSTKEKMLYVAVKDILHEKINLEKTNSWDSIETKKEKVRTNLIDNSWVLYNKIFNNTINEEIEKRIPKMKDIECNGYNENEIINVNVELKRKTISAIVLCTNFKYENKDFVDKELENILWNYALNNLEKQHHATTSCIMYDGRVPDMRVLRKLKHVGDMIDCEDKVIFKELELKKLIRIAVDNPVDRTEIKYLKCLKDYARKSGNGIGGLYEIKCNMRGFSEIISELIKERYPNSKYAN